VAIVGIMIMIILGIMAVYLYFETSQNTEKVTIQIPISEIPEIIEEPLNLDSQFTEKISQMPIISEIPQIIKDPLSLDTKTESMQELPVLDCSKLTECFMGKVTKIIDGDTIRVDEQPVRFALASAPEIGNLGGIETKEYIEKICPIGSNVIVDKDDKQTQGSYGRILAEIHCNGVSLNEEILKAKLGKISVSFCSKSEFSSKPWAVKYGCKE
jgi:endonuclease YncB( thermonuclease family)